MSRYASLVFFSLLSLEIWAKTSFDEYLKNLHKDPEFSEFSPEFLQKTFSSAEYIKRVVALDKAQPEFTHTVDSYLVRAVPQWKVDKARKLYKKHQKILDKVGKHYAVQPRFIVALWGIETNFGSIMGKHPIVSALATLAYDGRREAFFKKQLKHALVILQEGHITQDEFMGSWAGAMGQVQFMPSSFLNYAVDFDKDGKKDLWNSLPDAFASAAYYLQQHGWDNTQTWARQVRLPQTINQKVLGLKVKKTLPQWHTLGVRRFNGTTLPQRDMQASLIAPDGESGRAYLVYDNYRTLSRWNRSTHFVVSVGSLADRIVWPR